ncbi:VWA domain-containing protein [Gordonia sp. 852002-51296_SCH5728562-b]|uniref:VWA domain-containing protein n=1 Tax=Gordonia sp. 852002-51296_SCH5728562-b TaxID=1834101 RepID=UPI0009EE76CD
MAASSGQATPRGSRSTRKGGSGDGFGFEHREARSGRRGLWLWSAAALLLVVAIVGGIAIWKSGIVGGCGDRTSVSIAADPAIRDAVADATSKMSSDSCYDYTVTAVAGADVPGLLTSGDKAPDLWVPDSTQQARRVTTQVRRQLDTVSPSIAATPVVVAGTQVGKLSNWVDVMKLDGLRAGNPIDTSTGDAPIVGALAEVDAGKLTNDDLIEAMTVLAVQQNNARLVNDNEGTRLNLANTSTTPVVTTEQQLTLFTRTHPGSKLKSSIPEDGTVMLDYPLINTAPESRAETATAAAKELADALTAGDGASSVTDAGFRKPGDNKGLTVLQLKDPSQVDKALRQWQVLGVPIRTLVVEDTSGSMAEKDGGETRAQLTIDASLTGLKLFPNNTEIGGWAFGVDKGGPGQDWKELSPIRRLDAQASGGGTHRDELSAAVKAGLAPSELGGGTGLYDTTLAAFKKVQDSYDPNYSNSVIILTDGQNEDPNSISLQQLLSRLKQLEDPARPVLVLTIGISEDADTDALKQIAEATGGSSYVAKTAGDIQTVFVDAIRARVQAAGR